MLYSVLIFLNIAIFANPLPYSTSNLIDFNNEENLPNFSQDATDMVAGADDSVECASETSMENTMSSDDNDRNSIMKRSEQVCPTETRNPIPSIGLKTKPSRPQPQSEPIESNNPCTDRSRLHYLTCGGPEIADTPGIDLLDSDSVVNCIEGR